MRHYLARDERFDRYIDLSKAALSAGSLVGWMSTHITAQVWTTIIAVVGIFPAIEPYFPYKARIKQLRLIEIELSVLALNAEREWVSISRGDLTEDEILEIRMKLRHKVHEATSKNFDESLPVINKLEKIANQDTSNYIATYFPD